MVYEHLTLLHGCRGPSYGHQHAGFRKLMHGYDDGGMALRVWEVGDDVNRNVGQRGTGERGLDSAGQRVDDVTSTFGHRHIRTAHIS